jgi:death-on-curing protein
MLLRKLSDVAIEEVVYISYEEAVETHIELMRYLGETRFGVFDHTLIKSALGRPRWTATFAGADLPSQAATLLYGLIKNHPWVGGNKRTATAVVDLFLQRNGLEIIAGVDELVELVLEVEADKWLLPEIENWMRRHVKNTAIVIATIP